MGEFTRCLARTGYMLERGVPVSDVLWYLGDEAMHRPSQHAPFPLGFRYDYCNTDILTHRLTVSGGLLCTPEGLTYRMLWIPHNQRMLTSTVERIGSLLRQGALVVASAPCSPATLMAVTDFPEPDSPTSPRISPFRMVRLTPLTASRSRLWNFTCRF